MITNQFFLLSISSSQHFSCRVVATGTTESPLDTLTLSNDGLYLAASTLDGAVCGWAIEPPVQPDVDDDPVSLAMRGIKNGKGVNVLKSVNEETGKTEVSENDDDEEDEDEDEEVRGGEERSDEPTTQFLAPLACQPGISVPKLRPILLPTHSKPLPLAHRRTNRGKSSRNL